MINFIRDFIDSLSAKEKKFIAIGYAVFLALFYFIGIPGHKSLLTYVIGFLAVTLFYAGGVIFVKKNLLKD